MKKTKREFVCFKLNEAGTHYDRNKSKSVTAIILGGRCLHDNMPITYKKGIPVFNHEYDFMRFMEKNGYVVEGLNT